MDVLLAQPRGFCAGVVRAVDIVETALDIYGPPVYVLHEIVHNQWVLKDLQSKGAIFMEELEEVPNGANIIFSAHGVAQSRVDSAKERNLHIIDATCPLVTKVHLQVARHARAAREVILIGHAGHVEVNGTLGQYNKDYGGEIYLVQNVEDVAKLAVKNPDELAFVTQTTLSVDDTMQTIDALKTRFPKIVGPRKNDICYATQNRQNAVRRFTGKVDLLLVVGARNSSNSNRLRELGEHQGLEAHLMQDADDLNPAWFRPNIRVGLTAGASAPEVLVEEVLKKLQEFGIKSVEEMGAEPESVSFPLPKELTARVAQATE